MVNLILLYFHTKIIFYQPINPFIMTKRFFNILLTIVFSFIVTSCADENGDDPLGLSPATFEASMSGDAEHNFSGAAFYSVYTDHELDKTFFILSFVSQAQPTINLWFATTGDRPAAGTYTIIDFDQEDMDEDWDFPEGEFGAWLIENPGEEARYFFSNAGSIHIQHSSQEAVTGEFSFTATGFAMDNMEETLDISVDGSFNAAFGSIQPPGNQDSPLGS